MLRNRSRRAGFTLPEVLVTVAIVAILAAVVVPTVTQQIGKGDDSSTASAIVGIRTGITAFVADTRKFPGAPRDLFKRPGATDNDAFATDYGAAAVARWNGPYSEGDTTSGGDLALPLTTIIDSVWDVNSSFLRIYMRTASNAKQLHVDSLIDNGDGGTAGRLRFAPLTADTVLIYSILRAQ